jgi:hypothetical protein
VYSNLRAFVFQNYHHLLEHFTPRAKPATNPHGLKPVQQTGVAQLLCTGKTDSHLPPTVRTFNADLVQHSATAEVRNGAFYGRFVSFA